MNDPCRRSVLRSLVATAGIAGSWPIASATARAGDHPVLPLVSFLNYWDHHWYVWLKGHTIYEAVEIMSRDRGTGQPLVWVFFTERAPPKRQHHFLNDQRIAESLGWTFRDIAFSTSGPIGEQQGLAVAFHDLQDRRISIDIERDADRPLSTDLGGLTSQIGHGSEQMILLFFRERAALAADARVTIDGVEVSRPRPEASFVAPFDVAYSRNILVGGFPFSEWRATFDTGAGATTAQPHFVRSGNRWMATRSDRSTVVLEAVEDADLRAYIHRNDAHQLAVRFEPAIPPAATLATGFTAKFTVSLDQFGDLVEGTIRAEPSSNGAIFDWKFLAPSWIHGRGMRATMVSDNKADTRVLLRALDSAP
jgi:hypothetical protein